MTSSDSISFSEKLSVKLRALFDLMKFRLASLIAFSGAMGYSLAVEAVDWPKLILFCVASIAITGSANAINQILERDLDRLMRRTAGRPLPSGRLMVWEAAAWSMFLCVFALYIFTVHFNLRAALLALLSLILYGFVYTPLKRKGPIAVFVGAFPGAFPPMIGWIAATNQYGWEPGILFAIQFFWQFPHFWAIAWVLDSDYRKAGFKLLPSKAGKDFSTAVQISLWTIFLLPMGWLPFELGMSGITSALVATLCGALFLGQTFLLMKKRTDKTALQLMFGSFIYLPIVQIAFLLDKI